MSTKGKTLLIGAVLLAVAVALSAAIVLVGNGSGADVGTANGQTTVVRGIIGSEKAELFNDPEAQAIFQKHGLDVQVSTSGSWAMAEKEGVAQNDFASPSSEIAAEHLEDVHRDQVKSVTKPFYSPIAIATSQQVLDVLAKNGIASQIDGVWRIDMAAYLQAVVEGKRWTDLTGSEEYPSSRNVMITSTDVRSSNSALMYLALSSYTLNGNAVVSSEQDARLQARDRLSKLFLDQGYSQSSSAGPWESYLSKGPMNQPLTLIYESQFIEAALLNSNRVTDDMRIAYPSPTIFSDHVVVSFSENGRKVQDILDNDPDMAKVIAAHGFRLNGANSGAFGEQLASAGLSGYADTASFIDTAQAPSYEVLNTMLETIKALY